MKLFADLQTVRVFARAAYPSWGPDVQKWREQDYDAHFFVHAVKNDREKIGQRATRLPMGAGGTYVRVDRDNLEIPQRFFARWAADKVRRLELERPVFVAIPNRDGLVEAKSFNTARLARMAAAAFGAGAEAFTGLRFREYVPKEQGKRQSVRELMANMVLLEEPPAGTLVILDDVFTLGKHVTATVKMLPKKRAPDVAVVAGKTEKRPLDDMTAVAPYSHWCVL